MADLVYNMVNGPVGWVLFLEDERVGGVGTKEAASEAAMVAASFPIRSGDGVQIVAPNKPRRKPNCGKND